MKFTDLLGSSAKARCIGISTFLTALFFYMDISMPLGVAGGMSYIIVIAICLLYRFPRITFVFGVVAILLTIADYFLSPKGDSAEWIILMNRGMSIIAVSTLTGLGCLLLTKQAELESNLRDVADTDPLTGVASRRHLFNMLELRVKEATRYRLDLSVLILDLDKFKSINDHYGHLAGDMVLQQVAAKCAELLRASDLIGRYGGEEFVIVCPDTDALHAANLAERIRSCVEKISLPCLAAERRITVSIGISSWVFSMDSLTELLESADSALYQAKKTGRNKIVVSSSPVDRQNDSEDGIFS
jgi:diguanylate cyclase (GGDEF)-like protein